MMKLPIAPLFAAPAVLLAACGEDPAPAGDDAVTETQMDEVEVIDGTISDDMVDLDRSEAVDVSDEDAPSEESADGAEESTDDSEEAE